MTAFNPHHLVRQIPAQTWKPYLNTRLVMDDDKLLWASDEMTFAQSVIALMEAQPPKVQAKLHAELRRVNDMAHPRGIDAIANASDLDLPATLQALRNHQERALWVLIHHEAVFATAEMMLQFDLGVGKRSWKRQTISARENVSTSPEDLAALANELSGIITRKNETRRQCHIEVCQRHLDGGVQVNIYVEDDPNDLVEFVDDGMLRRTTRPANNIALVYYPETGVVDSVGQGGAKLHKPLVSLFAKHLLNTNIEPEAVKTPLFYLNRLRHHPQLLDAARGISEQVQRVRVRMAKARATRAPIGDVSLSVPASDTEACVLRMSRQKFADKDIFVGHYNVLEAVIAVHFQPDASQRARKPLIIHLRSAGTSNLKNLSEDDAALAEQLIRAWHFTEPLADVDLHLVA